MASEKVVVKSCPKCSSVNVKYVFGLGNLFGVIPKMKCLDCGVEMQSFPILETTKKDLKKKGKSVKKNKARKKK